MRQCLAYPLAVATADPILIKKYGNRRLYDTRESRYITLDELAAIVAEGASVRVVDVKSKRDLTQATLTQIVVETRELSRLLSVPLLEQLIRLRDDALAEFFSRWVTGALELYLQARRGVQGVSAWNPFAGLPFTAGDAMARLWMSSPFGGARAAAEPEPPGTEPPERPSEPSATGASSEEVAELRRELEALKRSIAGREGGGD